MYEPDLTDGFATNEFWSITFGDNFKKLTALTVAVVGDKR